MKGTMALAGKELKVLFATPLAWTVLAAVTALFAWDFLNALQTYLDRAAEFKTQAQVPGVTDLVVAPVLATAAVLWVWVVPLLSMRSIAEERRAHTLPLLFAAGLSDAAIVLGKYLGLLAFLSLLWLIALGMVASLQWGTGLDWGKVAAAALGLWCLLAALAAVGLLASAYARHPLGAALAALAVTWLGWMLDAAARQRGITQSVINYLAIPTHLHAAFRGVFASVDVVYFALLAGLALTLAVRRVALLRAGA